MTIRKIASDLHKLSVGGYFNGEMFTVRELEDAIRTWMSYADRWVLEIALPDGRWFMTINRLASGLTYCIPETREQEARLKASVGL